MTEPGSGAGGMDPDADVGETTRAPAPAHAGLIGAIVGGRYRLISLLGEGAMGAVYLGEHLKIGRQDAIKVLRRGLANDEESIARFNRGARLMSAIRHNNVCTLYDYGETDDGSPFLALELISGESLKELVTREQALDLRRAISITTQTANALDAAHDAGIVHRDLKPANIMIERARDGSDVVKVVDFDIAKGPDAPGGDEVTQLGFVVGTPEYMSPEQLTGEKLDGRSDVYSLGIVLFRLLTNTLPFKGGATQEIMIQRLTGEPFTLAQARPDLRFPPGLQPVLDRALARDRGKRYARAGDLAHDLTALPLRLHDPATATPVPDTQVSVPSSQPTKEVAPARNRSRMWMIGAAATIVIAVASVAIVTQLGSPAPPVNGPGVDDGSSAGQGEVTEPPVVAGGGGDTDVDADQAGGQRGGESGGSAVQQPATDSSTAGRGGGGGTPAESIAQPPQDPDPVPPATPTRVTAALAVDVLFAQDDKLRLDPDEFGVTRNLAVARAARDTAEMFWALEGLSTQERALAASIAGTAALALRDRAACTLWFTRVLGLRPEDEGASLMLNNNCPQIRG